jgi:hypothetical protein
MGRVFKARLKLLTFYSAHRSVCVCVCVHTCVCLDVCVAVCVCVPACVCPLTQP